MKAICEIIRELKADGEGNSNKLQERKTEETEL
jgi:hypothetical protein